MRAWLFTLGVALVCTGVAVAQDDDAARLRRLEERQVREEIATRYERSIGAPMPAADLDRAVAEALALRERQAGYVAERFAARALKRARVGVLAGPTVTLQVRSGAGGGNPNRVDMIGDTTPYVRERVTSPIPWEPNVDIHEPGRAFCVGGFIPEGKVFVITRVTIRAVAAGDSNGPGEAIVRAGDQTLLQMRNDPKVREQVWEGRVVIDSGKEASVQVQVANSSHVEATFEGTFEAPRPEGAGAVGWDPRKGVSANSANGRVTVSQEGRTLWEGEGGSVSTQTAMEEGVQTLIIVVDGRVIARLRAGP